MPPVPSEGKSINLLVLPPLPSPLQRASLWSAYKATFESLLQKTVPESKEAVSRVDVAVSLTPSRPRACRTALYPSDQLVLQEIYTLVGLAASRTNIDLDFPGGVDVRVFLINTSKSLSYSSRSARNWLAGPVVDVSTLIASSRAYSAIYSVESEAGEATLQAILLEIRDQRKEVPPLYRLTSGPSMVTAPLGSVTNVKENKEVKRHHSVIVGGTFDHLHLGHKLLLTALVYLSDPEPFPTSSSQTSTQVTRTITFGITGDELLVNKKHQDQLESWELRQKRTHEFVESILAFYPAVSGDRLDIEHEYIENPGPNGKTVRVTYTLKLDSELNSSDQSAQSEYKVILNYTQIADPYGPTITVEDITALIISAETRAGGKAVNDKRKEKGWKELEIFEVGVLDARVDEAELEPAEKEGFDGKLSSTEMRKRLAKLENENESGVRNGSEKL